jgi:hypothetical protein
VRKFSSQLEGPGTAPHFKIADIRKSVMGSGGGAGGGEGAGLPSHIVQEAQKAALAGGGPAVQKFMRENGYPNHGEAWCGEFAASVVHAAGGQPPKNPAVASNWRNWGEPTSTPIPGDIAVRRGVPTGSTGSHVTTVETGIDPKTGRFGSIGGNQGAMRQSMPANRYEFRHSPDKEKIEEAAKATKGTAEAMHGEKLRSHFGHRQRAEQPDILGGGQRAGLIGQPMKHEVSGNAHLKIDVNGPSGTQAKMAKMDGMFKSVKINRGRAAPTASQEA